MAFWLISSIRNDVVDDFAAGGFEGAEGVAGWDAAWGADSDVTRWQIFEPVDAAGAGVDGFEDADDDAAGDVAHVGEADFPVFAKAFLVGGAGLGDADVPVNVRSTAGGAGGAEGFADFGFENAHTESTVKDGLFLQNEREVVVHAVADFFQAFHHARNLAFFDVLATAADDVVGVVDAVPTDFFDDVHAVFAVPPGIVE